MLEDLPQETLLLIVAGAFIVGLALGRLSTGKAPKESKGDPRDARIRALEAEQRVARTEVDKTQANLSVHAESLAECREMIRERDKTISDQQQQVELLRADLKESVRKTQQLRQELTNRATEHAKSEVRLRDVENELSVAQASSDMIATGVLDYTAAPKKE